MKNGGSFHSYVKLPEGKLQSYYPTKTSVCNASHDVDAGCGRTSTSYVKMQHAIAVSQKNR